MLSNLGIVGSKNNVQKGGSGIDPLYRRVIFLYIQCIRLMCAQFINVLNYSYSGWQACALHTLFLAMFDVGEASHRAARSSNFGPFTCCVKLCSTNVMDF